MKKEVINAVITNNLFDFISDNYHQMSKQELAQIIKELDYSIFTLNASEDKAKLKKMIIENLQENLLDDEDFA